MRKEVGITVIFTLLLVGGLVRGEDLWEDHNPFSPHRLAIGAVIKLNVDEPVIVEYSYDAKTDSNAVIKMKPDKKISEFLPPANVDKSIQGLKKIKIKAKGRVKFRMAVSVSKIIDNKTVEFSGTRVIAYEAGKARQEIQITGRVNTDDITKKRTVNSSMVAGLQILLRGKPIPQSKNIPMKRIGTPPKSAAELSDEEKQTLLLEYLNRILGESSDK